jgi:hypothetical protein
VASGEAAASGDRADFDGKAAAFEGATTGSGTGCSSLFIARFYLMLRSRYPVPSFGARAGAAATDLGLCWRDGKGCDIAVRQNAARRPRF